MTAEITEGFDVVVIIKPGGRVRTIESDNVEKPTLIDAAAFKPSRRPIKLSDPWERTPSGAVLGWHGVPLGKTYLFDPRNPVF